MISTSFRDEIYSWIPNPYDKFCLKSWGARVKFHYPPLHTPPSPASDAYSSHWFGARIGLCWCSTSAFRLLLGVGSWEVFKGLFAIYVDKTDRHYPKTVLRVERITFFIVNRVENQNEPKRPTVALLLFGWFFGIEIKLDSPIIQCHF